MKKKYTLTLDKDIVEQAKKKLETVGGKLSSYINLKLKEFVK